MNIATKQALPRRTFLRGLGVSLALPLLDGMVPAFAALRTTAARAVKRLGAIYVPNGVEMRMWTPKARRGRLRVVADSGAAGAVPGADAAC